MQFFESVFSFSFHFYVEYMLGMSILLFFQFLNRVDKEELLS